MITIITIACTKCNAILIQFVSTFFWDGFVHRLQGKVTSRVHVNRFEVRSCSLTLTTFSAKGNSTLVIKSGIFCKLAICG